MKNNTYNAATALGINAIISNSVPINGIRYVSVPLDYLEVHPTVQRPLKPHYKKIAAEWDAAKCGCILVSHRCNHLFIIDGQNRYMAAKTLGLPNITCAIREGLTEQDEALLFGRQDDNKVRLRPHEKVKALVIGHDDAALSLKRVCDNYKIALEPSSKGTPWLRSIRIGQAILSKYGEDGLSWCFECIKKAHLHNEPRAYGETMMIALRNVYAKYGDNIMSQSVIAGTLKKKGYAALLIDANVAFPERSQAQALTAYLEEKVEKAISQITLVG